MAFFAVSGDSLYTNLGMADIIFAAAFALMLMMGLRLSGVPFGHGVIHACMRE